MSHPNIHVDVADDVGRIVIDRTERKNACTPLMWSGLTDAAHDMVAARARVVVITGAGGDFCSGADMRPDPTEATAPRVHGLYSMREIGNSVSAIHDLPMPVIAAVDGVAVGAGFGLALAADLLCCTDRARFSLIFAKRGLSLDYGTSYLLPQRIGLHRAKRMAFTGDIVTGVEARELGFVNEVVAPDSLAPTVDAMAEQIAAGPPLALSMTKRLLDHAARTSFADAVEAEALAQNVNFATTDTVEAMKAFGEKRTPEFKGR